MFDIRKIAVVISLLAFAACSGPQPTTQDAPDSATSEAQEVFEDDFESGEAAEWETTEEIQSPDSSENEQSEEDGEPSGE